ncbi:Hypothetical protein GbCGDNIH9_5107 [Granulibacter bethesdensis]|uniref:Uncharacterized protein n=1 Tax=Granulibacter bethesdensis TaxID=364410 RepID=A0AAC9KAF6_9PROT|nr:Hypothetical protein GbCGDNIH9_5107 [Granulibacter bethesdensis]APH61681.1 Hypothetical protein GbCGDNIH8_5107 [Granulibacter bethesdensis]
MADDGDTMKTGLSVKGRNETGKGFHSLKRFWNQQVAASGCQVSGSMAVATGVVRAVTGREAICWTI